MRSFTLIPAALLLAESFAQVDFNSRPKCPKGIQVITACGTGQSGYGTIDGLTEQVVNAVPGSSSVYLEYPANLRPYFSSVDNGVQNMTAYIQHFVDSCPNVKLVILGYSQGAHVSLSSLCGWPRNSFTFAANRALPSRYRENIIGVVAYGDPTHVYPTNYDMGNSTHDGLFPRQLGECDDVSSKIASWCDQGDIYCDNCPLPGSPDAYNPRDCRLGVHNSYWDRYNGDATKWVKQRYRAAGGNIASPSSNPSSTSGSSSPSATETPSGMSSSSSTSTSGTSASRTAESGGQPTETPSGASRLEPWLFRSLNLLRVQRR